MKECYICSSTKLKLVLDFGKHPPPLNLVTDEQIKNKNEKLFPLELFFCESCGLCQLGQAVDPNEMFKDYTYTSGVSAAFKNHLYSLAELIVNKFKLTGEDLVIDIASNDGTLLKAFSSYGVKVLGVEPSNVAKIAISDGINTVNDFFDESVAKKILEHYGQAKIITATNVLAHVDKLDSFLKGTKLLLKDDDGVFVSESQYLFDIFKKLEYDTIYHEHLRYYGLKQLKKLFSRYEMDVIHAERVSSHGGSIRVFACKKGKLPISTSVRSLLEEEEEIGLSSFDAVKKFVKLDEALNKPDLIIIATNHKEFQEIIPQINESGCKIIYDIWSMFKPEDFPDSKYVKFGQGINS